MEDIFLKEELDVSRTLETRAAPTEDPLLPMPGTELLRRYANGFKSEGNAHRSLSFRARGPRNNGRR